MTNLSDRLSILVGDVFEQLNQIGDDSIDCVVTSPPYWGLRDYGVEGQIGLEPTLAKHLAVMVAVFEEIKRVLKPSGTVWVNYGDCYATTPNGRSAADTKLVGKDDRTFRDKQFSTVRTIFPPESGQPFPKHIKRRGGGNNRDAMLKPKDLCMIPNRLAIALQDAGWWVRSEIIWAKTNPMPESIRDRPASSHEKIFMLTKAPRYFYDNEAVRQGLAKTSITRLAQDVDNQNGSARANVRKKTNGTMKAVGGARRRETPPNKGQHQGFADKWDAMTKEEQCANGRNLRNYEPAPLKVWNIATAAFKYAHFATFPPELAERCILAGCPKGGVVLDPFGGAGTTALVALRHGRKATLVELNPEYAELAERRIHNEWHVPPKATNHDFGPLFNETGAAA